MSNRRSTPANQAPNTAEIIANLARSPRIETLHPIAARFIYSLRLIAVHERASRDPVPELAVRLGSVEVAAKALTLAQDIKRLWPEDVHLARFCCRCLSHDEATIGAMISSAAARDTARFDQVLAGFIRPDRCRKLLDGALALIGAELRAA